MVIVTEYLARQVAARINELMEGANCKVLKLNFTSNNYTKVCIFHNNILKLKLEQYGIAIDGLEISHYCTYRKNSLKFDHRIEVVSERISDSLCPNSKALYDKNLKESPSTYTGT